MKKHPRCERIVLQRPGFDWGVGACTRLCAPCRCTVYGTIHCVYCIIPCHTMLVYYGVVHHDMEHHPSVMHHALVLCTPAACRDGVVLQPPPITPYHILVHRTILWLYLHAGHTEFQNRTCLGSILSMEYGCIDIDLYVLLKNIQLTLICKQC